MKDIVSDLEERFYWAMYHSLEAYTVLPDEKSYVRSDEHEQAIGVFKNLCDSVASIPPTLITEAERLRAGVPEVFEKTLEQNIWHTRPELVPANATEFVTMLNNTVQRDMVVR